MKILRKFAFVLFAILMLSSSVVTVHADSFTHIDEADSTTSNTLSRDAYTAVVKLNASDLKLAESLEGISDIYCGQDGLVYLLGGKTSRIVVLNKDYSLNKTIKIVDQKGEEIVLEKARGIYVVENTIYVCDTENSRILVLDMNGKTQKVWEKPESSLIPDGFLFQPIKIEKDIDGYYYVLSLGCYYGALTYSPEGEFIGFFGSNRVKATALDTLSYLWDLATSNDKKKSQSVQTLPFSFVDFCFDKDGYMITCTGTTTAGLNTGQISKISPGGSVILFQKTKNGKYQTAESVNFLERRYVVRSNEARSQGVISIDVDQNGFMYALENRYGLVYVYDRECNLISSFGGGVGKGERLGIFKNATALALHGDNILVADAESASVTVFKPTNFGTLIKKAQSLYLQGDYTEAKDLWTQVLALDEGNQLAYKGLAMASYKAGEYRKALKYAKSGMDYNVYDLAYQQLFKKFIRDYFIIFFVVVIALFVSIILLIVKMGKRKEPLIKNVKIRTALNAPIHPFATFEKVKYKSLGSVKIAGVIVLLFYVAKVLEATASGFLFTTVAAKNYNTLITVAQTIGLVLLWSVINWLICTLFEGKGRFNEVFTATSYALVPLIFFTFIKVIVSHFLPLAGLDFMNALYVVILLYTFYLLSIAMMTVHEFSFAKFILTSIVTLFGMLLVIFIGFMIVILLQQFWNFIYAVFMELTFR